MFYASAGNADIIATHHAWSLGGDNSSEVSATFSGQIQTFCDDIGAQAMLVSTRPDGRVHDEGAFRLEHVGKPVRSGLAFHLGEFRYAWMLARRAKAFGADVALVDSGVTHYFMLALFPLFGIPVVPILHNCLWPAGFRPRAHVQRIIQWLDAKFWRRVPKVVIAVSPEAERQVTELAGPVHRPVAQIRAQFNRQYFAEIPPIDADSQPFKVMFIGRVIEAKGVLDIARMARHIEDRQPGLVRWTVCGRGDDLERLRASITELGLDAVVETPGWVSLEALQQVYAQTHASIIPTRSGFAEGLAMTAAEAILAGRPIVSNPIVPALEVLRPAALAAQSNDWESHAEAVYDMATNRQLYRRLRDACAALGEQFYDRSIGLPEVLKRTLLAQAHAGPR
ncbi:MAG: glycosyltransferase family 4 protein [Devosia sp.]